MSSSLADLDEPSLIHFFSPRYTHYGGVCVNAEFSHEVVGCHRLVRCQEFTG